MLKIASIGLHFGEEPSISGTKGSGAIFFSNCNLCCSYCQNYQISQEGLGQFLSEEKLADEMLKLQELGCHNINLVSPTRLVRKDIILAKEKGLRIPIVYNTNGYDSIETLKSLEGYIDIYLPDIKYSDNTIALKYSGIGNYVERSRAAIAEMFRQVGNLILDGNDIAQRGLIVRHLVLPSDLAGSYESLKFLALLSKEIWISAMSQYYPCYKAIGDPIIGRKITKEEYLKVLDWIEELGFVNVLAQEADSAENYLPDFTREKPFSSPHPDISNSLPLSICPLPKGEGLDGTDK